MVKSQTDSSPYSSFCISEGYSGMVKGEEWFAIFVVLPLFSLVRPYIHSFCTVSSCFPKSQWIINLLSRNVDCAEHKRVKCERKMVGVFAMNVGMKHSNQKDEG